MDSIDDEDELLYGDSAPITMPTPTPTIGTETDESRGGPSGGDGQGGDEDVMPCYLAVLATEIGELEVSWFIWWYC